MTAPATQSIQIHIRVRKEDSAWVYFVLESEEGITAYSTLPFTVGDPHRDLELHVPPDFVAEVEEILVRLGDRIYRLPSCSPPSGD